MTNRADREAFLIANHASDDVYAAGIITAAQAAVAAAGSSTGGGGTLTAPDDQEASWAEDANGNLVYVVATLDNAGNETIDYYTDSSRSATATPVLPLSPVSSSNKPLVHLGDLDLPVDSTATVTPTIPAGTVGMVIQYDRTSGNGDVRAKVDGTAPTATSGKQIGNKGGYYVGKTPLTPSGDPLEVANFQAITEGSTGILHIDFYGE